MHHVGWNTPERVATRIRSRINPGERHVIQFGWQGGEEGHIVVLERPYTQRGNVVLVVDPQNGKRTPLERYLSSKPVDYRSVIMYRIDNLELDVDLAAGLMEGVES